MAVVLAVGLVMALTGCQTPIPSVESLIGTWRNTADRSEIKLDQNRDCHIYNMPSGAILRGPVGNGTQPGGPLITAKCSWERGDGLGNLRYHSGNHNPQIELDFRGQPPVNAGGITVLVRGAGQSMRLYWFLGDPDSEHLYQFQKVSNAK
jgi:hypothetical protein